MPEETFAGIVLKREDAGENDRKLTVFTREIGKTYIYAKGAKKPGSRLTGVTEPLTFARFQLASGKHRRFLTQAQTATSHPELRSSYERLVCALAMAELVAEALPYESPEARAFDLLAMGIDQLAISKKPEVVLVWFAARLLEIEGKMPDWKTCSSSGGAIEEADVWVSPTTGGSVSDDHRNGAHDCFRASGEALIGIDKISRLAIPPTALKRSNECLWVLLQFWQAGTGSRLTAFEAAHQAMCSQ